MTDLTRRGFLTGITLAAVAPAIVRAMNIMPVSTRQVPPETFWIQQGKWVIEHGPYRAVATFTTDGWLNTLTEDPFDLGSVPILSSLSDESTVDFARRRSIAAVNLRTLVMLDRDKGFDVNRELPGAFVDLESLRSG